MSNNLNLTQVAAAQSQKEVTINDQSGEIDAALTEIATLLIPAANAYTATEAELRGAQFFTLDEDPSPATAAFTVTLPSIKRGLFTVFNDTAFTATLEITAQPVTSPTLATGTVGLFISDGINVRKLV